MRVLFICLGILVLASPALGKALCEGNEPYWYQNSAEVGQPPFGGVWLLPGSLAITAMSLNARARVVTPKGVEITTRPGCLPLFIATQQPRPKASDY